MRPTIHTVAERSGVSIATVSRVLNASAHVSAETADRVRRAIDDLGYRPNPSARGLATNTTGTIALIFPRLSGPFFSELIRGAEIAAHETSHHLLIFGASGSAGDDQNQTLGQLTAKVDGLILASEGISLSYIRDLQRQHTPVVMLGRKPEGMAVDSIRPDNVGGASRAITHLIRHGYRRIALIKGPRTQLHAGDRENGYRKALADYGRPCRPELIEEGDFTEPSGLAAMVRLLQQKPAPDAVFAANDQMAIGALAAIHEAGLRVPEDIALVGFDDIVTARYLQPPLTTVHQDMEGQGQLAVRRLLSRINGSNDDIETQLIPAELVVRQSCGCTVSDSTLD